MRTLNSVSDFSCPKVRGINVSFKRGFQVSGDGLLEKWKRLTDGTWRFGDKKGWRTVIPGRCTKAMVNTFNKGRVSSVC
jgi:hypothetical protein